MKTINFVPSAFRVANVLVISTLLISCPSNSAGSGPIGHGGTSGGSSSSNRMGINLAPTQDYEEDRLYADVMKTSRQFLTGTTASGTPVPVDVNGWPTADFSFYVWSNQHMSGTYALSFTGKATVTGSPVGSIPTTYNAATNTSSGTFIYTAAMSTSNGTQTYGTLALAFTNTQQNNASATGTGVTNIQVMRPTSVGASTSFAPGTLFNTPLLAELAKFSTVRYMDFLATNFSEQTNWSDRPLPAWASFNRCAAHTGSSVLGGLSCTSNLYGVPYEHMGWEGIGGPLEHVVLLSNATNTDPWVNIPVNATDDYVTKVAQLFAFGSDGTNPYTGSGGTNPTPANPVYPPLNSNLNLYIEYSNELWNAGAFTQHNMNCVIASNELQAGVDSSGNPTPLNWDGAWDGTFVTLTPKTASTPARIRWSGNPTLCNRHTAERTVQISNFFRSVFGDAAMGTRIRPVLETQLGNTGSAMNDESRMLLDYYYNFAGGSSPVSTPHPPSYYIYGAGGSAYYSPASTDTTLDQIFADLGFSTGGIPAFQSDANYAAAMGVKRVAYEGGPGLDGFGTPGSTLTTSEQLAASAWADTRMTAAMETMHNEWSNNDGDLLVYYTSTGAKTGFYEWGFTGDVYNLSTPKLLAIDALNQATRAPVTYGTPVPGSVSGLSPNATSMGYTSTYHNFAVATLPYNHRYLYWASYNFSSTVSSTWTVNLTFSSASSASVAVYIDGNLIGTQSSTGGALSFPGGTVGAGLHGIMVRPIAGNFTLATVAVSVDPRKLSSRTAHASIRFVSLDTAYAYSGRTD